MEIPSSIKRRYIEIEQHLDSTIDSLNYIDEHKEWFILETCRSLSVWFHFNYPSNFTTEELLKYFKYMFRTKIILYWEKLYGK